MLDLLGMFFSVAELISRGGSWLQGRRLELKCMPVIDWVQEREEIHYCDKGRQIWDSKQNPGGPTHEDLPVVQLDLSWPNPTGLRTVPLVLLALQGGFLQGCIVQSPNDSKSYRAFVFLTHRGRRAWSRYCTESRMARRNRVFFMGTYGEVKSQFRRRDPRTEWSSFPPESPERMNQRSQADVTYGCMTPDIRDKMAEIEG